MIYPFNSLGFILVFLKKYLPYHDGEFVQIGQSKIELRGKVIGTYTIDEKSSLPTFTFYNTYYCKHMDEKAQKILKKEALIELFGCPLYPCDELCKFAYLGYAQYRLPLSRTQHKVDLYLNTNQNNFDIISCSKNLEINKYSFYSTHDYEIEKDAKKRVWAALQTGLAKYPKF